MSRRRGRSRRGKGFEDLRNALFGRQAAEHAKDQGALGQPVAPVDPGSRLRFLAETHQRSLREPNGLDCGVRQFLPQPFGHAARVNGGHPRGLDDEAGHRPQVIEVAVEAGGRQFGQVRVGARMIGREFRAVLRGTSLRQEQRRPRMVQVDVVQDGKARKTKQIGP